MSLLDAGGSGGGILMCASSGRSAHLNTLAKTLHLCAGDAPELVIFKVKDGASPAPHVHAFDLASPQIGANLTLTHVSGNEVGLPGGVQGSNDKIDGGDGKQDAGYAGEKNAERRNGHILLGVQVVLYGLIGVICAIGGYRAAREAERGRKDAADVTRWFAYFLIGNLLVTFIIVMMIFK